MRREPVRLVGRYELAVPVERGPATTVWRARDRGRKQEVAVQQIRFDAVVSDGERRHLRRRMVDRAQRFAAIRHPSVAAVHDVFEKDNDLYVVTDHMPAPTLGDLLHLDGPLDEESVITIGERLAAALAAIHEAGSVHGGITVHHVLVPSVDEARLRLVAPVTDGPGGNGGYQPPEEREPDQRGESDPAADVWRLGATLHHAVEGRPPATGRDPQLSDERTPALASLLADLLAPQSGNRPSAAEVRSGLDQLRRRTDASAATSGAEPDEIPPHLRFDATGDLDDHGDDPIGIHGVQATVADDGRRLPDTEVAGDRAPTAVVPSGTGHEPSGWRPKLIAAAAALLAVVGVVAAVAIASDEGRGRRVGDAATEAPPGDSDEVARAGGDATAAEGNDANVPTRSGADDDTPEDRPTVPDDWETHETSQYRFTHPPDWNVQALTSVTTQFRDPQTGTYARITTGGSGTDPVGEWRTYEEDFAARHDNYRHIRIEPFEVKGVEGAVWEYTYSDGGATLHAVNIKIPSDQGGYAFNLQSKVEHWDDVGALLETFLAAFEPAP